MDRPSLLHRGGGWIAVFLAPVDDVQRSAAPTLSNPGPVEVSRPRVSARANRYSGRLLTSHDNRTTSWVGSDRSRRNAGRP